jgi:hypothetical protein
MKHICLQASPERKAYLSKYGGIQLTAQLELGAEQGTPRNHLTCLYPTICAGALKKKTEECSKF